ncbi:MAG: hypothetical protein LH477_04800 [Nocardioides sp.]|nr:hypothetical protein [Nocardioides sp.]
MVTTSCARDSYWSGVGCELGQPAWLTGVLIPLLVVLLGLGAATLVVRRQLAVAMHARDAERLAPPVTEFGRKVLASVDKACNTKAHDPYWDAPEWDGHAIVQQAQSRLAVSISRPDVCREVLRGTSDVAAAWAACVQRRRELESSGVLLLGIAVARGIDAACSPLWNDVRRAGEVLARWDGRGPIPDFDPWPHPHVQPGGRDATDRHREARYQWLNYYADEFERVATRSA